MFKRYFIITNPLDDKVSFFSEEFNNEEEINDFLDDFHNFDIITILNEKQLRDLKEQLKWQKINLF